MAQPEDKREVCEAVLIAALTTLAVGIVTLILDAGKACMEAKKVIKSKKGKKKK